MSASHPRPALLAALVLAVLALVAALVLGPPTGEAAAQTSGGVAATVIDADDQERGTVTFTPAPAGGTLVDVALDGIPPGFHGFHIHEHPVCDPEAGDGPFTSAGGHWNPDDDAHGDHVGDLPALYAAADGTVRQQLRTHRFEVADLLAGPRAVIIHAGPDNHGNVPERYTAEGATEPGPDEDTLNTGDAGARFGCGEIVEPTEGPADLPAGERSRSMLTVDPDGMVNGFLAFTEVDGGVLVEGEAVGLEEGFHGFHIHQGPSCTDAEGATDFGEAGGHWDPGDATHRDHAGDMPTLLAGEDGVASLSFVTDRIGTLDDLDGRAVIIHAGPDNYANIPDRYTAEGATEPGPDDMTLATGDAGARDACGLVDGTALRLAGAGRIETSVAISHAGFGDEAAGAVVLARADRFADGLAGTPLAATVDGPLLLTGTDALPGETASELTRVLPEGGTVHLLGGEAAIAPSVAQAVEDLGFDTVRHAGPTRIETAIEIAEAIEELRGGPGAPARDNPLLITTGYRFPDALSAGAAAGNIGGAVLLTVSEERHPAVDAFLAEREDAEVFAVGGPAARPYDDAEPVFGEDRIETAVAVSATFFDDPVAVGVARQGGVGDDSDDAFADALTGGAHAVRLGGPVLLSTADRLAPRSAGHVQGSSALLGFVYGGSAVLAPQVHADLQAALAVRVSEVGVEPDGG